ncbi:c-type cytochrome domain-containing protein [Aestuariibaculum suncheonense]|uniref:Cytochrome c domain-containing protein n=1 Tax=Aestuariibaculum suncheonense TaxID=1028745 RepID=A0A8J6UB50_9FLAO|nr:c-type cytochrome domain-containing protein [Aestuariibaculum suncheonense]MBD0835560.1 hypothetical protein [Aestuariibaculum suncheonense]
MKQEVLRHRKTMILMMFLIFISEYASALNGKDVPRFVLALGRFHPLILHLPIGALLLTFFLDVSGRIRKNHPKQTIKCALGFSALFSIVACVFGYFLSLEDGYSGTTLEIHFWTGISTAVLISILFLISDKEHTTLKRLVFPLFLLTITTMSVAGHFGSVLTHGDDFITEYIKKPEHEQIIVNIDSLNMYDNVVLKVFEDKCIQCHNETKRKGGLSLISKQDILNGGDSGTTIKLGLSEESLLYKHTILPISDENHMPPEGKPQLSRDELWLIKYWLDYSDKVDQKVVSLAKNDTLNRLLKNYLVFEEKHIAEASLEDFQKAEDHGFTIRKLVPSKAELWVKFNKDTISKEDIKSLAGLREQITELDLSVSSLTDDMTGGLKKLENMEKLELKHTQITDKTLNHLKDLNHLKVLNLVGSNGFSVNGLKSLLSVLKLEHVYVWNTEIDQSLADSLSLEFQVNINAGTFGYAAMAQLGIPKLIASKDVFTDTLHVAIDTKVKNTHIFYTLNQDEPDSTAIGYNQPVVLDSSVTFSYKAYKKGWLPSDIANKSFYKVNYQVADFSLVDQPDEKYPGANKLFDFELGTFNFKDEKWAGFLGKDVNATVDLGTRARLHRVSVNCLALPRDWIIFPTEISVYASDNKTSGFRSLGTKQIHEELTYDNDVLIKNFSIDIPETEARYFKVIVKNPKVLPKWHEGAGNAPWNFVSEIMFW